MLGVLSSASISVRSKRWKKMVYWERYYSVVGELKIECIWHPLKLNGTNRSNCMIAVLHWLLDPGHSIRITDSEPQMFHPSWAALLAPAQCTLSHNGNLKIFLLLVKRKEWRNKRDFRNTFWENFKGTILTFKEGERIWF